VVYDDGLQTRCFTYIDDAIAGTLLAADSPTSVGEAFNIGSMAETSIGDTAELIAKLVGPDTEITRVDTGRELGRSYEDLSRRIPDNTKARTLLGWECATSLEDGLSKTIEWARENPWWLALQDSGAA
jgi:dTDP-alpha-D-glucuronic acid decarboxylase